MGKAAVSALLPPAVVIGLAALLHFVIGPAIGYFYAKVLTDVGIAVVMAVSLNLVNGYTGQFSIGHAAFMTVGGYAAGSVVYYGHYLIWGSLQQQGGFLGPSTLLYVVALLVGGLAAALAGFVVGLPSLRLRGDYLAIVTLGFGEIVRVLVTRTNDVLFDADEIAAASPVTLLTSVGGSLGFTGLPFLTNLFWVWVAAGAVILFSYRLKRSDQGRALLSIREDEIAAEAMGIPTTRFKVQAFVYAAFFAGIAGGLFAHEVGTTLNPQELGFQKSFEVVIMVVLGGMGSVTGTTIAAAALVILPEALRSFSDYRMIAYALTLILVMLLRPQGLMGLREVWEIPAVRKLLRSGR
ncbi:MAG: branched-chain amino acid ABC transporter permease [Alphaproteobacteria bacterium]|nr:branched-chain amino acid ABC transporter permease [Alphaproteobacteria bacterium]